MTLGAPALASVTAVAAFSFTRVFAEGSSALPAVFAGLAAHVAMQLARERRWRATTTTFALVAVIGAVGVWGIAPHTTARGAPTTATVSLLAERLGDGFSTLTTASVPIGPHSGIVLLAAVGSWLAAIAAEWVAFRARATLSAAIPAATLFTVTAALGTDRLEAIVTGGFVAATLLFLLTHAPAQADDTHAWFRGRDAPLGRAPVLWAGLPLVLIAAVVAPLLGPRLPEARSAGLLDLAPTEGPRTRVTVSPLVDIRNQLTRNPPVEVFTVSASRPTYWRMAALETYDGQIWSSLADYDSADSTLPPGGTAPGTPIEEMMQEFRISNLAQFWLPAAYRPVSIDLPSARVNPDSLTLLTEEETAAGLEYSVVSHVPAYGPDDLVGGTGRIPREVEPMLTLPGEASESAVDLARQVTDGHDTVYEQALALQNWFREEFTYNESVPAGHSGDRMTDFLVNRAGYCEQFSATYAVMARSLGIPARVAVGFTPGTLDPGRGGYAVTTSEAHAWPEVWIDPYGWVAFEPTPSRFDPSPANHTGTLDQANGEVAPEPSEPQDDAASPPPDPDPSVDALPQAPEDGPGQNGDRPWTRRLVVLAALLAVAAVAGALLRIRRGHRRHARRMANLSPRDSILVSWDLLVERLRRDGIRIPDTLTPAEATAAAASERPELWTPMDRLRERLELAAYSVVEPGPADVELARMLLVEIEAALAAPRTAAGAGARAP